MSLRSAPQLPGVELSEVIGTGGSGVVYRGRQVAFDRPVAVTVIPAGGSVVVPLRYDGQREDYRLDLVQQGGRWLVDGPVGR